MLISIVFVYNIYYNVDYFLTKLYIIVLSLTDLMQVPCPPSRPFPVTVTTEIVYSCNISSCLKVVCFDQTDQQDKNINE